MCYVADTTKRKGDARWKQGIFLGKSVTNDMFLVHCDGNVRLTRSVKATYKDWSDHMGLYRTLVVQPWHIEGTIGNRMDPAGSQSFAEALPLDDEAGDDPPEDLTVNESFVGVPIALTPISETRRRMKPPPATAAVASEGTPMLTPTGQDEVPTTPGLGGPPAAVTPFDVEDEGERIEPLAKRQKLSTRRVGGEEFCHMDIESYEHIDEQIDSEIFDNWVDDDIDVSGWDDDDNLACENGGSTQGVSVWMPISELQPELSADDLKVIDAEADKIEVERLLSMSVITTTDGYSGKRDIPLSAKMVRTWRKKAKTETDENGIVTSQMMWMRRSRLVGRDFNFLEYREDVYSPASSSSVVKLLPCMAVSGAFVQDGVIATLDVADAFL